MAGELLRAAFRDLIDVPVEVNRRADLPAYAGPRTLVVGSSYSGSTSETLAAFEQAVARGCKLLAITSGGAFATDATAAGAAVVPLPSGFQPRAALGHLGLSLVGALERMGVLPSAGEDVGETVAELERLAPQMAIDVPASTNPAKQLATLIGDGRPR